MQQQAQIAHEILTRLYETGEREKIELIKMHCDRAIEEIDKKAGLDT